MKIITETYDLINNNGTVMNEEAKQRFREEALKKIETCARESHLSQDRATGAPGKFVKKIVNLGHLSVLRHVQLTVHFIFSRGINIEMVRHQLAQPSPTQESTRFIKYDDTTVIDIAPAIDLCNKTKDLSVHLKNALLTEWQEACEDAEKHYIRMLQLGAAPEIARSVLNNSLKAGIYLTANLEEWMYILQQRCSPQADPQMREITRPLYFELCDMFPEIFNGILK